MAINLAEDIHSVTELKRNTCDILAQVHRTGRPVVVTVNGKADVVILDVKSYEEQLQVKKLVDSLETAEQDVATGKTRSMKKFLKEFKHAYKISG